MDRKANRGTHFLDLEKRFIASDARLVPQNKGSLATRNSLCSMKCCPVGKPVQAGDSGEMFFGKSIGAFALAAAAFSSAAEAQRVTSNFGVRSDPFHGGKKMHAGMDMGAPTGTPVYATGDGYVRRSRVAGGYGNLVEMDHGYGYQTRFGHLSKILVSEGQFVRRGQMIGLVGSTGRSTGPHLHYEVRIGGKAVQPANYMQIVFNNPPDWAAVRTGLATGRQAAARPASIAMARAMPSGKVIGDIEIDYRGAGNAALANNRQSGFSAGHAKFSER